MELTDLEYVLKVKTKFVRKTVFEEARNLKYDRELVILLPELNDQCMKFFRAWLPEVSGEHYELVGEIGHPVNSPVRLSVHRAPHEYSPERHFLFVMSKGVEEILLKSGEGKILNCKILPEKSDEMADFAKDSDEGNYQTVEA